MLPAKPEHLKTFDYLGPYQYFLTFCTHARQRLFVTAERVQIVRTQIERAAGEQRIALLAYCYMPDHVHLLAEGQAEDSDCLRFISRGKQFSGFHYKARFGHQLWQGYGYEHTLRAEERAINVARYIVDNPLRARLVERVQDYPFLGSSVDTLDQMLEAVQMRDGWHRSG